MSHGQTVLQTPNFAPFIERRTVPNQSNADLTDREAAVARRESAVRALTSHLLQSQESERLYLARELHDDIAQRLALATSEIGMLVAQEVETTIMKDRLRVMLRDLNALSTDVHQMSHGIHSFKLQYLGLQAALADLCEQHSRPGFLVSFRSKQTENPNSNELSLCLYRVAQEALANAAKHSHSTTVVVTIAREKRAFLLTVEDRGVGFDSSRVSPGLGLMSMAERVDLAGGHLSLRSSLGTGTKVLVNVSDKD
jgi:signal transduction histidine kinase